MLRDGRQFRLECWATEGITNLTFFLSTVGLEQATNDELRDLLVDEGLIEFVGDYHSVSGAKLVDAASNELWSINLVVGDENGVLTECSVELSPWST